MKIITFDPNKYCPVMIQQPLNAIIKEIPRF
jgi:hypothetical protein